jgi:hypothetical protein
MIEELVAVAASLPLTSSAATLPHVRRRATEMPGTLHRFAYLAYIAGEEAPDEEQLFPALDAVLRAPHQALLRSTSAIPIEAVRRLDDDIAHQILTAHGVSATAFRVGPLHLPASVRERTARPSVDVPENCFVLAFLEECADLVRAVGAFQQRPDTPDWLKSKLARELSRVSEPLSKARSHPLWRGVTPERRPSGTSIVLERRIGYRQVCLHSRRLRLSASLPLSADLHHGWLGARNLADIFETWCFLSIVGTTSRIVGTPSTYRVFERKEGGTRVRRSAVVKWRNGISVYFNTTFRPGRPSRHSYSVDLRPDVVLKVPEGANAGLHVFDAKFRRSEQDQGRRFKHNDLHKMHTYRDALRGARSAWIVYPGDDFAFFGRDMTGVRSAPRDLGAVLDGVGAVPHRPGLRILAETVERLLAP